MTAKKLHIIVGTRPNFIKVTRFKAVAAAMGTVDVKIIHTGQHFDEQMSKVFFQQFNLSPDHIINLESSTPNSQIAEIMQKLENYFTTDRPDIVMVVGDVNSTLAGALVANKLNIRLVHLESGLRSYDRTMPEEVNRILTDQVADGLFVTEQSGVDNLLKEQKAPDQVYLVGNTMIDTLLAYQQQINASDILQQLNVLPGKFILITMHRPATVDNKEGLQKLLQLLKAISTHLTIVFPIHPRTRKRICHFDLDNELNSIDNLILTDPMDYFAFQKLIKESYCIITDSGGIQEEATLCKIPCLTLRPNTERPVTIDIGSNTLIPFDVDIVTSYLVSIEKGNYKEGGIPPFWDGKATERVLEVIERF